MDEKAIPREERTGVADGVELRVLRWEPLAKSPIILHNKGVFLPGWIRVLPGGTLLAPRHGRTEKTTPSSRLAQFLEQSPARELYP